MPDSLAPISVEVFADQAGVLQALAAEAQQAVRGRELGQLVAAGAVGLESHKPGVEGEDAGGRLGCLLGIAVDGAHALLGGLGARHGVDEMRALGLQGAEPLGVGLLTEGDAGALEGRQHASGIEPGALVVGIDRLGSLDALLGGEGLALQLGQIAIDRGELALDLGDAGFDRIEALLRVLGALLLDLVLVLQGGKLGYALAIDRTLALLQRAFDAAVLGHSLHALAVDLLGLGIELALVLAVLGSKAGPLRLQPRQLLHRGNLLAGQARLPALRGGDALLLLGDAAPALLHLLHEVCLDLGLGALRSLRQARQLLVVGLPALGLEQTLGLLDLPLLRQRADVGDDAADLAGGADLGRALAGFRREDGIEMRVEGEEHRGAHGGQEHHPQHGILDDQAKALHVGRGDVAAAPEAERQHRQQQEAQQKIHGNVGEPHHIGFEPGVGKAHGLVLVQRPIEYQPHECDAEQHADAGIDQSKTAAFGVALVQADGKALADQPRHDQHHALDAERDEYGQQRRVGKIADAVEGRVAGRQRKGDAGRGQQCELPIVSKRLLDAEPDAVVAEQDEERQGGKEEWIVLAYDRDDAVHRRLDIEAHLPSLRTRFLLPHLPHATFYSLLLTLHEHRLHALGRSAPTPRPGAPEDRLQAIAQSPANPAPVWVH